MRALLRAANARDRALYQSVSTERRARGTGARGDRAYVVYAAVLVTMTLVPLVMATAHHVLEILGLRTAREASTVVFAALTVAAVAMGRVRGPISARLPDIDLILTSPLDRAAILASGSRRWMLSAGLLGAVVGGAASVRAGGLVSVPLATDVIAGAGAGFGLYLWFVLAQWAASSGSRSAYPVVVVLGLGVALLGLLRWDGNPAAWAALAAASSPLPTFALALAIGVTCVLAGLAVVVSRAAARSIPRAHLRLQELAWGATKTGVLGANPQLVAQSVLRESMHGRAMSLRKFPRWVPPATARDLLAMVRRWPRSVVGVALAAAAASLASAAPQSLPVWFVAVALVTAAAGVSSVGLRSHADNLGRTTALEPQDAASFVSHLVAPALVLFVGGGTGIVIGGAAGGHPTLWPALVVLAGTSVLAQGVPSYSTQLPLYLIGPIITPAGDLSPLAVAGWLLRVYVLTLSCGFVLHAAATAGSSLAFALWSVACLVAAAAWSLLSLHRERAAVV